MAAKKKATKKAPAKAPAKAAAKTTAKKVATTSTKKKAASPGKLGRLVVFGASQVAVAGLEALGEAGFTPDLVLTHRVMDMETWERTQVSPVQKWGKRNDRQVILAEGKGEREWLQPLLDDPPDLVLTIGWSLPLPSDLLEAPRLGCVGIHTSNLPKFRGANPVRAVLSNGDKLTGVTVYKIEGPDWDGPILHNEQIDIGPQETHGELEPRMRELCAEVAVKVAQKYAAGRKFQEKKQDDKRSTETAGLDRRHRRAPWWLTAQEAYNRLRAYQPEPGLETFIGAKRVEILGGKPMDWMKPTFGDTGTFLGIRSGRMAILCSQSTVFGIDKLRLLGGKTENAADYARRIELSIGSGLV